MSFDFEELLEEQQRLSEQKGGGGNRGGLDNFVKMPDKAGYLVLRLMPAAAPDQFKSETNPNPAKPKLFAKTRIHNRINNRNIHCPNTPEKGTKRWLGECQICKLYRELWKRADKCVKDSPEYEEYVRQASELRPAERFYWNAVVLEFKDGSEKAVDKRAEGPKIYSVGTQVQQMLLRAMLGDREMNEEGLGDITDLTGKQGRSVKVIKTMKRGNKGEYAEYSIKINDPSAAADPDTCKEWMGKLHDLDSLRRVLPHEEIKRQLQIHRGVIKDESGSDGDFNPNEFMKGASVSATVVETPKPQQSERPSASPEVTTSVRSQPASEPAPAPAAAKAKVEDDIADPDFLAELEQM